MGHRMVGKAGDVIPRHGKGKGGDLPSNGGAGPSFHPGTDRTSPFHQGPSIPHGWDRERASLANTNGPRGPVLGA